MIMSDLQSTCWFPAILNVFDGFIPRSTFITINVHISHSVCVDPPLFDRFPPKKVEPSAMQRFHEVSFSQKDT